MIRALWVVFITVQDSKPSVLAWSSANSVAQGIDGLVIEVDPKTRGSPL